jgi:hypothetical protein
MQTSDAEKFRTGGKWKSSAKAVFLIRMGRLAASAMKLRKQD